jgi:cytochrome c-type biogenesis protein CcmF
VIPELGHFALLLALVVAVVQGTLPLAGAARGRASWMALARPAAETQFVAVAAAFACLVASFLRNDFSVAYVAAHSNSQLPTVYRAAATWGGHEGSLLLWLLILTGWSFAVSRRSRELPDDLVARVLGVMGLVAAGFSAFILLTSNPFDRLLPAPPEGRDLNPLLQDPGLVMHPPMLYMGYVGFSVAFAFALAALISGRFDAAWARWSRPWTTVAWGFLTLGIALGSWWAYYELGWGGWWFWDPVENASFMPWLVGTALIHSLAVTEKRGAFRQWTVLLAIAAFSLSLIGTFLVRSGVLTSVHAFASDPRRGLFILGFLVVVIGGSLALFAWRAPAMRAGGAFALASRETLLLANNVLLVVAAGTVLLGTLYPLAMDALGLGKLSVGPPYFDTVFVPLMVPLLVVLAAGPLARWKRLDWGDMARRLRGPALLALVAGAVVPWTFGAWRPMVGLGLALAAWIAVAVVDHARARLAIPGAPPRAWWGMEIAHLGVAVFVAGVTLVKGYEVERDVTLRPGDTVEVAGTVVRFRGVHRVAGPNWIAQEGDVDLMDGPRLRHTLHPQKRHYPSSEAPTTETAISPGWGGDWYVALGEPIIPASARAEAMAPAHGPVADPQTWIVRVYRKPFVEWIWLGAVLMALGGAFAAADPRYRLQWRRGTVPRRDSLPGGPVAVRTEAMS